MPEPTSVEHVLQLVNDTLVNEFELDRTTITAQARMREDLGMDSLDGVDLIVALEKSLGVQIPEETARQMKTVGDIYAYVEQVAAQKAAPTA